MIRALRLERTIATTGASVELALRLEVRASQRRHTRQNPDLTWFPIFSSNQWRWVATQIIEADEHAVARQLAGL